MSFATCVYVMLGGALGTLGRYAVSALMAPYSRDMPWGTLLINAAGSLLIGLFGTLTLAGGRHPAPEGLRLFVMVGVCGGFTTFSSFSLQTFDLLRTGGYGRALLNVVASVALCLAAVWLGHLVAAHLNAGAQHIAQTALEEDA